MQKTYFFLLMPFMLCGMYSCSNKQQGTENSTSINDSSNSGFVKQKLITLERNGIKLTEMKSVPFNEPELYLESPSEDAHITSHQHFVFSVEGDDYKLGAQTDDKNAKLCSNSSKGQHIHFIINNGPYTAHYEPEFDADLEAGRNNVMLAFLSRSYHESIKSDRAFVLKQFNLSDSAGYDLSQPMLFYSRPKGNYIGQFAEKVMLDFYLVNCNLSEKDYKVKATVNGTTFILTKWRPYIIEGLPMGENTIRLELLDNEGQKVHSPFNDSGNRVFILSELAEGDKN